MSMEHKAFLFDTEKFHAQIEPVLQKCCLPKGEQYAVQYIGDNYSLLKSPYTGDELDEDWEDELEANTLQEYLDFILTACYDPEEEIGLGYDWEYSLKAIGSIETKQDEDCHSWVLGSPLVYGKITIDPGAMGLGIISTEKARKLSHKLCDAKNQVYEFEHSQEYQDKDEAENRLRAYDALCEIYQQAAQEKKGVLFTF